MMSESKKQREARLAKKREYMREYMREYYATMPDAEKERHNAQMREYYQAHRDELCARQRERYWKKKATAAATAMESDSTPARKPIDFSKHPFITDDKALIRGYCNVL